MHVETNMLQAAEAMLAERNLPAARVAFQRAFESGCELDRCSAGLWLLSMLEGDFEAAWQQSDAIRARGRQDPHRFWNGVIPAGAHLIVRSLHGLGDAVQMLRYAPRLRAIAASVIYEVPANFVELARCFAGVEQVITWGEGAPSPAPAWTQQVEINELAYLFRTVTADLSIAERYLELHASLVAQAHSGMGSRRRPRIGVVWAAGDWNPDRSLELAAFSAILEDGRFEFWSLQGGAQAEVTHPGLRNAAEVCGGGLLHLSATIANLDLVLTVDTLAAHLAGALGIPAWVLLEHAADWRWMDAREDSPWYPSLRLFRQPGPGDWGSVLIAVQQELETMRL